MKARYNILKLDFKSLAVTEGTYLKLEQNTKSVSGR